MFDDDGWQQQQEHEQQAWEEEHGIELHEAGGAGRVQARREEAGHVVPVVALGGRSVDALPRTIRIKPGHAPGGLGCSVPQIFFVDHTIMVDDEGHDT